MSIVYLPGEGSFVDQLGRYVELTSKLGPAAFLFPELLIHKGQEFVAAPRPVTMRRGVPKQCFKNAALMAIGKGYDYVEGLLARPVVPGIAIHHAWCCKAGSDVVIDNTIETVMLEDRYFGIRFTKQKLMEMIEASQHYGFLVGPIRPNYKLILELDPSLEYRWDMEQLINK